MTHDEAMTLTLKLAHDAGVNGASWVIDGNTTDETCTRILAGIDDGDPEVMDAYNPPNLSGEYTGDMTDADLADELGLPRDDDVSDYADAFNEHASSAFWAEIERLCRHRLADDEPQGDDVMVFGHPMTYWYRGDV